MTGNENQVFRQLKNHSLFRTSFGYFDTPDYLADDLFIKYHVKVKFEREWCKDGSKYRFILISVKKKDTDLALLALNDLSNKMVLCGFPDYPDFCASTWNDISKGIEQLK